jgi:hypothetical protein
MIEVCHGSSIHRSNATPLPLHHNCATPIGEASLAVPFHPFEGCLDFLSMASKEIPHHWPHHRSSCDRPPHSLPVRFNTKLGSPTRMFIIFLSPVHTGFQSQSPRLRRSGFRTFPSPPPLLHFPCLSFLLFFFLCILLCPLAIRALPIPRNLLDLCESRAGGF